MTPPISTPTAIWLFILYTLIYVVPLYLSPKARPSASLSRDDPSAIKARITSVTATCVICSLTTFAILVRTDNGNAPWAGAFHSMGYWPAGLAELGRALLLTATLFLGPLFEMFVVEGAWREWMALEPVRELLAEWTTWRNIVAGPVTEEVLFRSAAVPLMVLAQTPLARTVFLSPVLFGLAHFHHFYEFRITHPRVPVAAAVLRSVFQLGYTSLFGAYATFLYLRTGSLLAICAVHAFCNSMGLPRMWGPVLRLGQDGNVERAPVGYTVAYYVLLVAGAVMWWRSLWVLTESTNALTAM